MTTTSAFGNVTTTGIPLEKCQKILSSPCEKLNETASCFGITLPVTSTSFELVTDAGNLVEVKDRLLLWSSKKCFYFFLYLLLIIIC